MHHRGAAYRFVDLTLGRVMFTSWEGTVGALAESTSDRDASGPVPCGTRQAQHTGLLETDLTYYITISPPCQVSLLSSFRDSCASARGYGRLSQHQTSVLEGRSNDHPWPSDQPRAVRRGRRSQGPRSSCILRAPRPSLCCPTRSHNSHTGLSGLFSSAASHTDNIAPPLLPLSTARLQLPRKCGIFSCVVINSANPGARRTDVFVDEGGGRWEGPSPVVY